MNRHGIYVLLFIVFILSLNMSVAHEINETDSQSSLDLAVGQQLNGEINVNLPGDANTNVSCETDSVNYMGSVVDGIGNITSPNLAEDDYSVDAKSHYTLKNVKFSVENEIIGTYTHLQSIINDANSGDAISLDINFAYTPDIDGDSKQVHINKTLVINGNGHVIDGKGIARILRVTAKDVILNNITFKNANFSTGFGGAISWSGDNGTVVNSIFINNTANYAGAIDWQGKDGIVEKSVFINNTATGNNGEGGAIHWGNINGKVVNSKFINNSAIGNGGAISWKGRAKNGSVINTTFNNSNGYQGGAILIEENSLMNIENSSFYNNNADYGGALFYFLSNGNKLKNVTFENNSANIGGAVVLYVSSNGLIENCTFNNNSAQSSGAIYAYETSNYEIINSKFYNNIAVIKAGSIYVKGNNTSIINSTFKSDKAKEGGAIYISGNNVSILNSTFDDNFANNGSAIYLNGNNGKVIYSNFTNNNATLYGGAVLWNGDNGLVINSRFVNNHINGTKLSNYVPYLTSYGGAIWWNASTGNVYNSYFENNTADGFYGGGGAIYWNVLKGNITNSNFTNSYARDGGAICTPNDFVYLNSNLTIDNCRFEYNRGIDIGGAVYSNFGNTTINNSYFNNNSAYGGGFLTGGAVYLDSFAKNSIINNTVFIKNYGKYAGGAILLGSSYSVIDNSTFIANIAGDYGGDLFV